MSSPSQVNSTGIGSPSPNAGEEISIVPSAELCGSNGSTSDWFPPHAAAMSVRRTRADRRATERGHIRVRGVKEVNVAGPVGRTGYGA